MEDSTDVLYSLRYVDIPLPAEHNAEHRNMIKRCLSSQSLGIFRLQTEAFLLCYDSKCFGGSSMITVYATQRFIRIRRLH